MRGTFPVIKDDDNGCQYSEVHMDTLINATNNVAVEVKALNASITTLNGNHKDVVKYLLIVVCVIALGRSVLDVIPSMISKAAAKVVVGQ